MSAFTDEKRRGYAEQQLPPAAGSGGAPAPQSPAPHTSARRARRRRHTDTSNTAQSLHSEISGYTPPRSLQKQGGHMAQNYSQVNKTLWNKTHVQECKLN